MSAVTGTKLGLDPTPFLLGKLGLESRWSFLVQNVQTTPPTGRGLDVSVPFGRRGVGFWEGLLGHGAHGVPEGKEHGGFLTLAQVK